MYEDLKSYGYNLFDKNDKFYTDICTPYKSQNGTDVLLSDRFNDIYKSNELGCQDNCEYSDYSIESEYLKCECNVVDQSEIELEEPEKLSAKSIAKSFINVLKYSNYKVLKCSKLVFSKKSFSENIGSILTILYLLGYLSSFILFCYKRMNDLNTEIQKVYEDKISEELNNDNNINNNVVIFHKDNILNTNNDNKSSTSNINHNEKLSKKKTIEMHPNEYNLKTSNKNIKGNFPPKKEIILKKPLYKKKQKEKVKLFGDYIKDYLIKENKGSLSYKDLNSNSQQIVHIINQEKGIVKEKLGKKLNLSVKKEKAVKEEKKIIFNYDDYELNNLEYLEAIEYDKRTFIKIYWSLLKREHLIIFTFFAWNDFNIFSIKLSKFFHAICTDMVFNVFFFSDESMHNLYQSGGVYNFVEQFFQMVISTIVSQLLQIFLNYLSMTDVHYYTIKSLDKNNLTKEKILSIIKCIKYKLIIFHVMAFLLFLFYWYVVTAFCAVYVNTQRIFITNSLLSFFMGLIYPFGIYLIPTGLRYISLKATSKKNLKIIYFLSNIIPFF